MAPSPTRRPSQDGDEEEEDDDYMSMVIADPTQTTKETSLQRTARKKREAELRSRQKTKQEREADEAAAREAALARNLDSSNKGFKMMAKLGYKPGSTLGKALDARTEPIHLAMKEDRGGIGMDNEKKRRVREAAEAAEQDYKRAKVEEVDYRERIRQEREEKRLEAQVIGAQKVTERLDTEAHEEKQPSKDGPEMPMEQRPLRSINVLWRGLVKVRREREAQEKMKLEVQNSLTYRRPTYDSDEDEDDKSGYANRDGVTEFAEQDLEDEDPDLDEFNELHAAGRLGKLVAYLRSTYKYCFWCKYRYPDTEMDGCPGLTEEDHE